MKNINNNFKSDDDLILEAVRNQNITHQNELVAILKSLGRDIPQSTLSRRLKKLGIAKINNIYTVIESRPRTQVPILNIKLSLPNIIVLHTLPGHADTLAYQLDEKISFDNNTPQNSPYKTLCGTIAGDDTVLVISDGTNSGLEKLKKDIEEDFVIGINDLSFL
jgi:transcriptional regulator of arginine metabolism